LEGKVQACVRESSKAQEQCQAWNSKGNPHVFAD
jgi:hypothetical protein